MEFYISSILVKAMRTMICGNLLLYDSSQVVFRNLASVQCGTGLSFVLNQLIHELVYIAVK